MKSAMFYLLFLSHFSYFLPGSNGALNDGDYLITIPRVFRAGTSQNVGINIFGKKSCEVTITLYDSTKNGNRIQARGHFKPNEAGVLEVKVPEGLSRAKLVATVCGVKTKEKVVTYEVQTRKIFVQTDKPIYKPGQKVLIRIMSVNSELKPAGKKISSVVIQEPGGVKIMKWTDVDLLDGIANLDLELSNEPVLGKWLIKATVEGLTATKEIEINKYVLPKFRLDVKAPLYFAWDQTASFMICARNTHEKTVSGRLETTLCLMYSGTKRQCLTDIKNVTGCQLFDTTELVSSLTEYQFDSKYYYVNVEATFTETSTGIKVKETARSPNMVRKSKTMAFVNVPSKFKPGIPLAFKIKVNYLDGRPVTRGRVRVEVSGRHFNNSWYQKHILSKRYTVTNGLIYVDLENVPISTKTLKFKAIFNSGHLEISKVSKAWYSPSLSYLKLVIPQNQSAKVGSQGSVQILSTSRLDTSRKEFVFQYKILCKGKIILSGAIKDSNIIKSRVTSIRHHEPFTYNGKTIRRTNTHQFWLMFNVTQEMVPSCRILVYYVKMDKETVGDTIVYNVEDKLENQFSVEFVDDQKRPGEKTKIVMKAKPGSHVAISALDKSVLLLRDMEEVTKGKVMEILSRQDIGPMDATRYSKCKSKATMPLATDVSETFNNAGVLFLSSLNIYTQSCRKPPTPRPISPYRHWWGRYKYDYFGRRRSPGYGGFGCFVGLWFYKSHQIGNKTGSDHTGHNHTAFKIAANFTNGESPMDDLKMETVRLRKYFPETWLWMNMKFNDTSDIQTLEVQIPDTAITSWVANGFAMSSVHGMGISNQAILKTFQPFFVQMTLPYSVVRGEELTVQVTVFNYLTSCVPVKLELLRASEYYMVTSLYISKMCVCGEAKSVKFRIIPKKIGYVPLTVKATTSAARLCPRPTMFAGDAVTKQLLVEPEGTRQQYSKGTFFCATETGKHSEAIHLPIPPKTVPGSVFPVISIVGDIVGPALTNLDGLLEMPYGCGEQNMAKLAPNIYIMDYLTNTNQVTKEIKDEAIKYMRTGYQRQLTKKRKSGSYSAWGNSDSKGSIMLTAFVVRSFARARKYVFVDDDEIKHSIQWLKTKQNSSGCFPQYGTVLMKSIQGGINSELTTTAYVIMALLEFGLDNKTTMVSRALGCLTENLDRIQDSYATSLVTYTLMLADHPKAEIMLSRLRKKAITLKDGQMFWSATNDKKVTGNGPTDFVGRRSVSADVEMTGYALMSYLKRKELVNDVMKIVKWLSQQRNGYGGFSSTQDTCVALQALSEAAQKYYCNDVKTNLTVSTSIKDIFTQDFTVTGNNKLILQRSEIPSNLLPNDLTINTSGTGCALLQATVKYNIPVIEEVPAFKVRVSVHRREATDEEGMTACYPLQLKIYAEWLKEDVSNMAIVDVKLVSGFTVNERLLRQKLKDSENVFDFLVKSNGEEEAILKRYEINGQNVILYFDEITTMNFTLDIIQSTLVKKQKPGVVKVYDYYEPENQARVTYNITDQDCYGERLETECPKCLSDFDFEALFDRDINCTTYLRRVKSFNGLLSVKKAYIQAENIAKYSAFPYAIPEFCPCDEVNNGITSLVFGQSEYLQRNDVEGSIVLNPDTTVARWDSKKMRNKFREKMVQEIYQKCWRQGKAHFG